MPLTYSLSECKESRNVQQTGVYHEVSPFSAWEWTLPRRSARSTAIHSQRGQFAGQTESTIRNENARFAGPWRTPRVCAGQRPSALWGPGLPTFQGRVCGSSRFSQPTAMSGTKDVMTHRGDHTVRPEDLPSSCGDCISQRALGGGRDSISFPPKVPGGTGVTAPRRPSSVYTKVEVESLKAPERVN